jgi:glycosyltransferase involved in cell wall biosynthesis
MVIFQILEKNQFDTGSVHQMFQAAEGLRERGHSVVIVSRQSEALRRRAEEQGIEFAPLPLRNQADLPSIRRLRALVQTRRPDVIHVHKGLSHTLALAATFHRRVPAFVVNRGVSFPLTIWNRPKYRTRRVDRVVTVCEQIRQVVIETGKLLPERVSVIYAGTDMSVFSPERWDRQDFRREKSIAPDAFLIAQVGVRDWKGWRELIDAFAVVHPRQPLTQLALIACKNREQEAEVRSYATDRGVGHAVLPVEYRSDMARVLSSADLVVDASWAGTGITGTIREAMALRKPVIATDCGGNRELVSSREVGWLIPVRDQRALVAALGEVIENRERAEKVAGRALDHVRSNFSKTRRIDALETLYADIVGRKMSSAP